MCYGENRSFAVLCVVAVLDETSNGLEEQQCGDDGADDGVSLMCDLLFGISDRCFPKARVCCHVRCPP
jgi:hypothetical protein